jgi:hypothetical protein
VSIKNDHEYTRIAFDDGTTSVRSASKIRAIASADGSAPVAAPEASRPTAPAPSTDVAERLDRPAAIAPRIARVGDTVGVNDVDSNIPDELKDLTQNDVPQTKFSAWGTRDAEIAKAANTRVKLEELENAMREVDFTLLPENLQKLIQNLDVALIQESITAYPAPRVGRTTEPKIGERKAVADRTAQPMNQPEARLVEQFKDWLVESGYQRPTAIRFPAGGGETWAEADLWIPEKDQLVEAKADATRESVRMAIGQVLDYAHLAGLLMETEEFPGLKSSQPSILLPALPTSDLLELIKKLGIVLWVQSNQGFQEIR